MYQELLDLLGIDGWEATDATLICPCGYEIEPDGRCPEGCVSILRDMGMI